MSYARSSPRGESGAKISSDRVMVEDAKTVVRFGVFEFDAEAGDLRRDGKKVHLAGQPVEILGMLLERPGRVVSREELRSRLWPADTFVEFEHSLNAAVMRLRQALSDNADAPRYIETVPRRGYRFLADVRTNGATSEFDAVKFVEGIGSAIMPAVTIPAVVERAATLDKPHRKRRVAIALAATLLIVAGIAGLTWRLSHGERPRIRSLAVLPLSNFSSDAEQEFFADGMTEEITTDLSKIEALRVISRTSAMRYKGTKMTVPEIARELNVDALIEGSVQRQGDRVRITLQLVQASDESHLWSASYDRALKDVLELRKTVARDVAEQVRIKVTPQDAARITGGGTFSPEAYEAFLKGRHCEDRGDWPNAVVHLTEAVRGDPNFALAWAHLAEASGTVDFLAGNLEHQERTLTAGMKACQLSPELSNCHIFKGDFAFFRQWDWQTGQEEFARAVELDPGSPEARLHTAAYSLAVGDFRRALAESRRAQEIDPRSPILILFEADSWERLGDRKQAAEVYARAIRVDEEYAPAYLKLAEIEAEDGAFESAVGRILTGLRLAGRSNDQLDLLERTYQRGGWIAFDRLRWQQQLDADMALMQKKQGSAAALALDYAQLGDRDRAMHWLQVAYDQRVPRLAWLKTGNGWDPLRPDPRFQQILRKMNYPEHLN